jgi:hypothetical protein
MKNVLLILFGSTAFLFGQGTPQEQSRVSTMNELMKSNTSSLMMYYKPNELDIKGSRYFHNEYVKGELWFMNDKYASDEYVYKFDEVENTVQVKGNDGQEILVDATKIKGCRMIINGKSVFYFGADVPTDYDKRRLFQLLYNSENYRVIKLPQKKLIPTHKVFHNDDMQFQYNIEHRYFIKTVDGQYAEFKLTKKGILKIFPDRKVFLEKLFETEPYKERMTESLFVELLTKVEIKDTIKY